MTILILKKMINGIDISEQNGNIDLAELNARDIRFVYIKTSEAIDSPDRCFSENLRAARKSGVLAGAYHWLHPRLHVGQQAEFFINTVGDFSGLLPPAVCLETHRAPRREIDRSIKAFLNIIEEEIGTKPVIYTSTDYWKKYMDGIDWACDYSLWLDQPGSNWPPQVFPWAGWTFWQYAYKARIPGIPAFLGLNWFNGAYEELESMIIQ